MESKWWYRMQWTLRTALVMHHFYYSCLHWGIFASLGKLYLYRCTHSWMNPLFFWVCVQHVALQCGKTKQGTRSMEGKTCFALVLLLQKTTQNFPDLWDQLYFLRPQQEFKGQWSPWKEILAGWALGFQLLEAETLVNSVLGAQSQTSVLVSALGEFHHGLQSD